MCSNNLRDISKILASIFKRKQSSSYKNGRMLVCFDDFQNINYLDQLLFENKLLTSPHTSLARDVHLSDRLLRACDSCRVSMFEI